MRSSYVVAYIIAVAGLTQLLASAASGAKVERIGPDLELVEPFAVDFDRLGNVFICEYKGQKVTRLGRSGKPELVAGTGEMGRSGDGGPAAKAALKDPHGIAIARSGSMYIADTLNHQIRRVDLKSGIMQTLAGTGEAGFSGDGGPAVAAKFQGTFAIAVNPKQDRLYVADLGNRRVRMIDLKSGVVTTVAGNGQDGAPKDGAQAIDAPLQDPRAVAVDSKNNLYILERRGNALRVVKAGGEIRTLIRPGTIQPDLNGPKHLCVDRDDSVIIADAENHLIRRYDPKTGKTVIIAGTGTKGNRIETSDPLKTELNRPHGVTVDRDGGLWIADSYNHRVLRITR